MNAFIINLPPLREKREDIPVLANYFLDKFARGNKKKRFSKKAIELLTSYGWPGNVRELANVIERAVLISAHEEIIVDDFPEGMLDAEPQDREQETLKSRDAILKLNRLEKEYIERVLNSVGGNKSQAARLLGITRKTLYSKINKYIR
jgi:DNA-binding NtrC family response regulator